MKARWIIGWSAVLTLAAAAHAADGTTRATMARSVDALRTALPLSVDSRGFADPANRAALHAALEELARSASELPGHAAPTDAGFAFLSRSLERDADAILRRFEAGEYDAARFLLHEVTENCVACHARLPDPKARPLGLRLVDDATLRELPLRERVRLEVATRQFDRALASYATLFAASDLSAADLDLLGLIDAYLEVCLRVRLGSCDPEPTFALLAARGDLPGALSRNVVSWRASWEEMRKRAPLSAELPEVRRLTREAQDTERYPDARSGLVPWLTASGLAHLYLAEGEPGLEELAETYFWLGTIETRVGRSFWPSEGEYYLEAAVEVAPASAHAEAAYQLLEELALVGYTGSDGGELPPEVDARLQRLRRRIDDAGRLEAPDAPKRR